MRSGIAASGLLLLVAMSGCGSEPEEPAVSDDPFCAEVQELVSEGRAEFESGERWESPTEAEIDRFLGRLQDLAPPELEPKLELVIDADLTDRDVTADGPVATAMGEIWGYLQGHCGI